MSETTRRSLRRRTLESNNVRPNGASTKKCKGVSTAFRRRYKNIQKNLAEKNCLQLKTTPHRFCQGIKAKIKFVWCINLGAYKFSSHWSPRIALAPLGRLESALPRFRLPYLCLYGYQLSMLGHMLLNCYIGPVQKATRLIETLLFSHNGLLKTHKPRVKLAPDLHS